jgi:hypothetical protein
MCNNGAMTWSYRARLAQPVEVDGAVYDVTVHVATHDGTPVCVGVDVRGYKDPDNPPADGWPEVNTRVLKALRLPDLVAQVWQLQLEASAAGPTLARGKAFGSWIGPAAEAPRRGRRRLLNADGLVVVADAYQSTTRNRVDAVIEALTAHLGYETGPEATRDQANKAIRAARDAGLLPPSNRTRKAER